MATFGYTIAGADQRIMENMRGSITTVSEAGMVTNLHAYIKGGSGNIKIGLYDSGKNLLGNTVAIPVSGAGWYSGNVSIPVTAGTYYFGIIADDGGASMTVAFDAVAGFAACYTAYTWPTMPASWGSDSVTDREFSIYATYIPLASPPYPPTLNFSLDKIPRAGEVVVATAAFTLGWDGVNPTTIVDQDFIWDFGDGSPLQRGQSVQHTFPEAKSYLVTLSAIDSAGQPTSVQNYVTVIVSGQYYTWFVGFESPEDIMFPKPEQPQGIIQQYPFQSEQSWYTWNTRVLNGWAEISRVPSPINPSGMALRIALISPEPITDIEKSRMHIRHLWNPKTDADVWEEAKYYIPPSFRWVYRQWIQFHTAISEAVWDSYNNRIDSLALGLAIFQPNPEDGQINPDGTYPLQALLNFYIEGINPSIIRTHEGVDLTKPFKIKSHVHRPIDAADPTLETAGGYLEVWINDVKATWYDLYTKKELGDKVYCRTCGVNPDVIMALPTTVVSGNFRRAWVESGIDFYTGSNDPNTFVLQNEMFFEDVTLATLQPPPPLTATLQGYVKDKVGVPIAGAIVTCDGYADITEIDGAYAFVDVPAKQYSLNITKEGYESPQPIIVDASLGGTFSTDVVMIISPPPTVSKLPLAIPAVSLSTVIGIAYLATRG